jgi:hypothetical protein
MLARKTIFALLFAIFVLELSRNASNTIRYSNLVLVITGGAILTRFFAGYILKFPSVAFDTSCLSGTTIHFITSGTDFTQCGIGWVGE